MKVITNPKPGFICIYGFNQECELLIVRIKLNKNDISDVKCKFNSTFTRYFLISSKTDCFTLEFQINKWNEWRRTEQWVTADWTVCTRWMLCNCTVSALWTMTANGAESEIKCTVSSPWAYGKIRKKWKVDLFTDCIIMYNSNKNVLWLSFPFK